MSAYEVSLLNFLLYINTCSLKPMVNLNFSNFSQGLLIAYPPRQIFSRSPEVGGEVTVTSSPTSSEREICLAQ